MDEQRITRASRLSTMLIVAAIALPAAATAAVLILRRYALVHYTPHTLALWLVADGVILSVGLILQENESLPPAYKHRRRR